MKEKTSYKISEEVQNNNQLILMNVIQNEAIC